METIIKIVLGIIIGAVGFWLLQTQKDGDQLSQFSTKAVVAENKLQANAVKDLQVTEKEELKQVKAELYEVKAELERYKYKSASSSVGDSEQQDGAGEELVDQDKTTINNHLQDVPEEFHQLVDPPERFKSFAELHKDFVNEEPDLSWALATEQQITTFIQNHQNSGYLLYFSIKCKATVCELMAKVRNEDTQKWNQLANDMVQQAWWDFRGNSSTGTTIENGQIYINARIFSRKTSQD